MENQILKQLTALQKVVETMALVMATKDDLKTALTDHLTTADLQKALANHPTKAEARNFATKTDLESLVTKTDARSFATKTDLGSLVTKTDARSFATKTDLGSLATRDDLSHFEKRVNKRFLLLEEKLTKEIREAEGFAIVSADRHKVDKVLFEELEKRVTRLEQN